VRELAKQGAASQFEALTAEDAASVAREELLLLRQQAAEIGVEIADRKHAYGSDRLEREFQVREAEVGLTEAETLAVLGQVRAPEAGRVESLLVSEGEVVQAGTTVARIIPSGRASSAVVFAPSSDAAFLREGLRASLEFPSLPVSEYGKAQAKVARVGNDLALPAEIRSVPGADLSATEGLIRVELTVVEDAAWTRMQPLLNSGAPVVARIETRKRRIITLVFDFLRAWYPDS
jgi:multidrug resistance efflux pump